MCPASSRGREKFIKLNTNENPYPCSPAVGRAIAAVVERGLQRYPDPLAEAFRVRAAAVLGVEPNWILCGNGSDDILDDRHPGLRRPRRLPAAAVSQLHPLQDAGPTARGRGRGNRGSTPIGRSGDDFRSRRGRD